MADVEKARTLFEEAGLAFPDIPQELAERLKERDKWLFATREVSISPYNLEHYVCEANVKDYVIVAHSGHGVNSYALQYYVVYKILRMFLHLGWGGVYMDAKAAATQIHDCFSLANEIIPAAQAAGAVLGGDRLTIVGSDFYGSYWSLPGENRRDEVEGAEGPALVLAGALRWFQSSAG
jgi:hypothetical protein